MEVTQGTAVAPGTLEMQVTLGTLGMTVPLGTLGLLGTPGTLEILGILGTLEMLGTLVSLRTLVAPRTHPVTLVMPAIPGTLVTLGILGMLETLGLVVTLGPPVTPGTPEDPEGTLGSPCGWAVSGQALQEQRGPASSTCPQTSPSARATWGDTGKGGHRKGRGQTD